MEASENADPASELFAGLDECYRIPALDARGTGGIILTSDHITPYRLQPRGSALR